MKITQRITIIKSRVGLTVVLLLLSACATGALDIITPVTVKLSNYKSIILNVSSYKLASYEAILETATVRRLREKGLFEKVIAGSASPDAQADFCLNAKIEEIKPLGIWEIRPSGDRLFSGQVKIVVEAEIIDLKTGRSVGAFKVEGMSSRVFNVVLGNFMTGMAGQASERVADRMVEFVQKNM